LAIHPNEDCIAAGTVQGQIILWYNYFSADCEAKYDNNELQMMDTTCQENGETHSVRLRIKPVRNVLHWHSLPVLCLQFTTEGSFLLSGGYECVLVKWMHKTGQKDFLPRLGAPLSEIVSAKDNTLYAVQHSDNSKLINLFSKIDKKDFQRDLD
jgi:NET1-associated nuclear protein 1 (U3 small nucleolar RNA-associated protein 17)